VRCRRWNGTRPRRYEVPGLTTQRGETAPLSSPRPSTRCRWLVLSGAVQMQCVAAMMSCRRGTRQARHVVQILQAFSASKRNSRQFIGGHVCCRNYVGSEAQTGKFEGPHCRTCLLRALIRRAVEKVNVANQTAQRDETSTV